MCSIAGACSIFMVWRGRYSLKLPFSPQLPGGKPILFCLGLFACIELLSEFRQLFIRILACYQLSVL